MGGEMWLFLVPLWWRAAVRQGIVGDPRNSQFGAFNFPFRSFEIPVSTGDLPAALSMMSLPPRNSLPIPCRSPRQGTKIPCHDPKIRP
jgi:hypothetical protein